MPLQKQTVPVQLGLGVETKTDPKQLQPGQMLVLENCTFQKTNAYQKRNGFDEVANYGAAASAFVTRKRDLLAFGSNAIKKYNADNGEFVNQNITQTNLAFDPCKISSSSSITGSRNILYFDSCVANNVRLVAWIDDTNRYSFQLFNAETGSSLTGIIVSNTGTLGIKTIALGNYLVIIFSQPGTMTASAIDTTDPTYTPLSAITPISDTVSAFDVCVLNNAIYLAAFVSTGDLQIRIINHDISNGLLKIIPATDCTFGLTISPDTTLNELWVAHVPTGSANAKYMVFDSLLTSVLAPTTFSATSSALRVENPAVYASNGSGQIFYNVSVEYNSGDSNIGFLYANHSYKQPATRAGTLGTLFDLKNSVSIISKPFTYTLNGTTSLCILVGYNGHSQGYAFVINETGNILAKIGLNGIAAGYIYNSYNHLVNSSATTQGSLPEITSLSDTVITVPILEQTAAGSSPSATSGFVYLYGVNIITLDFDSIDNLQFVETATQSHITGGFLGSYDGETFSENGFLTIPEPPQRINSTGPGTNFAAGTYQWVLVFEWFDAQNNFHQSAVSEVTEKTFVAGVDSVNMLVNPNYLSYSPKTDRTFLSVYGTQKDGSIFYRLTSVPTNISAAVSDNYNSGSGRVGFPQLYTTGGELDNDPMPACTAIFKYRNRIFIVPSETPNTLWYSKSEIQGIPGTPIQFSSSLQFQVNTTGGNTITGVQIDDKCVLFKPTSMFYFVGDGPNATGSGNDFTPAVQIPSPVGTMEARSVEGFQNGAIFKSLQGWYLIDRSLNISYIGAAVEAFNDATVISTTLMDDTTQIRVVLDTGDALVYDWLVDRWDVYTNYGSVCAGVYNNTYTRLLSSGALLQETSGFSDNGQFIAQKIQTGWISFAGLQGFQRVYKFVLLGEWKSEHALRIKLEYDFDPNPFQTVEFTPSDYMNLGNEYGDIPVYGQDGSVYGGISFADYPIYQFRIFTQIQKCQSIRVTIEEIQDGGAIGEGFQLSGMSFEVGVEGGVMRVPAERSFG